MTPAPSSAQAAPHGFITRGVHWLSAALVAYGYAKGLDNLGQLSHPGLLRFEVGFALILGALFAFRLFWTTKIGGATRLPHTAPKWEQLASRGVHLGLYVGVFGIVLSGLGIALAYSSPVLGGFAIGLMVGLHEFFLAALPILLVIHVAGALWHKLVRRDGVLESMTGKLPI